MTYRKSRNSGVAFMSRLSLKTGFALVSFVPLWTFSAWHTRHTRHSCGSCLIDTRTNTCNSGSKMYYILEITVQLILACHVFGIPLSPVCPGSPLSPLGPSREIPGNPLSPGSPGDPTTPVSPLSPLMPGTPGWPGVPGKPGLPLSPGEGKRRLNDWTLFFCLRWMRY